MNVFVSWSGPRSKALGTFMAQWLPDVIQDLETWVSTEDLPKGSKWFSEISEGLKEMKAAVVCVTPENVNESWLLFEAGAAAGPGHPLITYLFDIKPADIDGPLANFQHTRANRDDTFKMVVTINEALGDDGLAPAKLERQFDRSWGELDAKLTEIGKMEADVPEAPKREADEMIAEILIRSRQHSQELAALKRPPPPFMGGRAGMKGLLSLPEGISPKTLKAIGRMIKSAKVVQEEAPEGEEPTGGKSEDGEAGGNA